MLMSEARVLVGVQPVLRLAAESSQSTISARVRLCMPVHTVH